MKNIRAAILAVCLGTLGNIGALAQSENTAYGTGALYSNTTGSYNSAFGYDSLYSNTSGSTNTAFGVDALYKNTTGVQNMAFGYNALSENTTGVQNTAFGNNALSNNSTGSYNFAMGEGALASSESGNYNVALGQDAISSNDTGTENVGIGWGSLINNTEGSYNVAIGQSALGSNFLGSSNIAIGVGAGINISSGPGVNYSNNIDIANAGMTTDDGITRIGTQGTQTAFFAAGVSGVESESGTEVFINSSGQLGTSNSSIRYKEDVHDMADASSAIFRLRPVTYRYKPAYADGSRSIEYGLIAEEVAEVYPDLVVRDAKGEIQTVQYQKLTPMLLNELQKQHQIIEQMEKTVAQQQQTILALKTQQTETIALLEKRLAALEAGQSSAIRLQSRLEKK